MPDKKAAFTLVEILIAVAVFGVIALMVYMSFGTIMNSLDSARKNAEISRTAGSIIWIMTSELNNALLAEGLEFTAGEDENGVWEFVFYSSMAYPAESAEGLFRVSYIFDGGTLRKETGGDYFILAEGFEEFSVSYYNGENWLNEWRSEDLKTLPVAAEISFNLRGEAFKKIALLPADEKNPGNGTGDRL
jgi:prepilin-type N-terminal cleavage/methylation domain-containing protein